MRAGRIRDGAHVAAPPARWYFGYSTAASGSSPPRWLLGKEGRWGAVELMKQHERPPRYVTEEGGVLLFDVQRPTTRRFLPLSTIEMSSSDGRWLSLLTRSSPSLRSTDRIDVWDMSTGRRTGSCPRSGTAASDFPALLSSDGRWLLGTGSGAVHLWSVRDRGRPSMWAHGRRLWPMAFAPDAAVVATIESNPCVVALRDARTGRVLRELKGHRRQVNDAQFSPDGATLATASNDGTVKLWRIK